MFNTKAINLLRNFEKSELRLFGKFVQSPFFNTNPHIVRLYQGLKKAYPDFTSKKIERKKLFNYLFPEEPYREIKIQQFMSELVKLIERFWTFQEMSKQPVTKLSLLANGFRKRELYHYWERSVEDAQKELLQAKLDSSETQYHLLQINIARHEVIEDAEQRDREPNLQKVSDDLDEFFLINKLKYYCKALNYQRFKSEPYQFEMAEEALRQASKEIYAHNHALKIYYHIAHTLKSLENEDHFQLLKEQLLNHYQNLNKEELQDMFVFAKNFCIQQMNTGNKGYLREIFELYRFEIQQGLIAIDGKLTPSSFKNISTAALMSNELEWLGEFLEEYKSTVDNDVYLYNLAHLRFHEKNYKETLKIIEQGVYEEVLLSLSAKGLMLKTYYELHLKYEDDFEYEDKLELLISSFLAYLYRKKEQVTKHYIYYLNMVKFVRELFKESRMYGREKNRAEALKDMILSTTQLAEKLWLEEKANELLAK